MKRTPIILSRDARNELEQFSKTGVHSVKLVKRARIILGLDTSENRKALKQNEIAEQLDVSRQTVNDVRKAFLASEDVSDFLQRKKRVTPPVAPKVTGELEARIIAMACGAVPPGCAKWTLRLIASKCVELHYIDAISHTTVSRVLKKRNYSLT